MFPDLYEQSTQFFICFAPRFSARRIRGLAVFSRCQVTRAQWRLQLTSKHHETSCQFWMFATKVHGVGAQLFERAGQDAATDLEHFNGRERFLSRGLCKCGGVGSYTGDFAQDVLYVGISKRPWVEQGNETDGRGG